MRIFWSSFVFVLTLIVAALAFAATAIQLPGVMRDLIATAQQLPPYLANLGLPNSYLVWVDILLSGDKLVLMGYILATRFIFALIGIVFGPLFGFDSSHSGRESAFNRWG